jgi:hypothetical protein
MISQKAAAEKVKGKLDLYKACRRNDFFLPALNSEICTVDFLQDCRFRKVWFPMSSKVKGYVCVSPPSIAELHQIVTNLFTNNLHQIGPGDRPRAERLLQYLSTRVADQAYYVGVIGFVTEGKHEIFHKSYVKPKPQGVPKPEVFNADGFYDGLPESQSKIKKMRRCTNITKEQQADYELRKVQFMIDKLTLVKDRRAEKLQKVRSAQNQVIPPAGRLNFAAAESASDSD